MKPFFVLALLVATFNANFSTSAFAQSAKTSRQSWNWPTFDKNTRGKKVEIRAIQYLLKHRGFYKSRVDGAFGAQTLSSTKAFQRAKGLKVDGIVGGATLAKLVVPLKRGDRGDGVRALQLFLARPYGDELGEINDPELPIDGVFGRQTAAMLQNYQSWLLRFQGVKETGTADALTWCALFGGDAGEPQ